MIPYRLNYERYFLGGKLFLQNSKLFCHFHYTERLLRLSMYDCSNFVYSCRIFGISEIQTV
jgi:hypothetical protein